MYTINHLNIFKNINKNNKGDLNKLKDFDFNIEYISEENENFKLNINSKENNLNN